MDKLAIFDFTTIDEIPSKAHRVEQALRQQTGRRFGIQAGESYRKGPDSTFNWAPPQGFRLPGQPQNEIQRQQGPPQGQQNHQHNKKWQINQNNAKGTGIVAK